MADRALVVGASGGIGKAICDTLTRGGSNVTELSRSRHNFDVTDPASVESHMQGLAGTFETVVIASGILAPDVSVPEKSLSDLDAIKMAQVFAVNAIGPALVLQNMSNFLPRKSRSVIAILTARIGSIGDNRLGGWYSYRASKAAANQIVRSAAIEISRKHPHAIVVALHPGTVETEFTKRYSKHPKIAPNVAADRLIALLKNLTPAQSGSFLDLSGKNIPW